jgi:hypothetical protein
VWAIQVQINTTVKVNRNTVPERIICVMGFVVWLHKSNLFVYVCLQSTLKRFWNSDFDYTSGVALCISLLLPVSFQETSTISFMSTIVVPHHLTGRSVREVKFRTVAPQIYCQARAMNWSKCNRYPTIIAAERNGRCTKQATKYIVLIKTIRKLLPLKNRMKGHNLFSDASEDARSEPRQEDINYVNLEDF